MESRWPRNVEQQIFPGFLYAFASANLYWSYDDYQQQKRKNDWNNCLNLLRPRIEGQYLDRPKSPKLLWSNASN